MKRATAYLLTLILALTLLTGCGTTDSSSSDDKTTTQSTTTTVTSSIDGEVSTTLHEHTSATTDITERKTTTGPSTIPNNWIKPTGATTTTARTIQPTVAPVSRLPEVKFSVKDSNIRFTDMVNLPNGGFAVSGHRYTETVIESIIQIYDKNAILEKEYKHILEEYEYYNGNGFDKLALCSDGGFIAASFISPHITKINSNLETEWSVAYGETTQFKVVYDIEEINPNCYAVAFASFDDAIKLKNVFLDKNGEIIETIDVVKDIFPEGTDIISDGNGGFYLLTSCNKSVAEKYPLVAENYDSSKATEAIIMHFSADRELIWVKTLGGGGNDWIEETAIDGNGNIYLAVGTDWNGVDSFWDMSVDTSYLNRRMLVKLNKNGDIVYKAPLSNKTMGVDQVFGIHIKDNKAYVVGMSDYFDSYQEKYPCEQISPSEKGYRVFCVYNVCIDGKGEELDRKIFRCDINDIPCDSLMLPNGSIVIGGIVSTAVNSFNLQFPVGVDCIAALFICK